MSVWHTLKPEEKRYAVPVLPSNFPEDYADKLYELLDLWDAKLHRNKIRQRYYDGKNHLKDFGISTPPELLTVETVVGWPQKAVDSLATRSRFDGFSATDEAVQADLNRIVAHSRLRVKYRQAVGSELIHSCCFATVGTDDDGEARIDLYSAEQAAAVWDDAMGRIAYGMVVVDWDETGAPCYIDLHLEDAVVHIWTDGSSPIWDYEIERFTMGRPLMEAFAYRPTYRKPFGQSRINRAVMSITDSAVRAALGGDISFQFAVSPQKYLLGADKDAFGEKTKWEAYIGNIMAVAKDQDGMVPQFGQLSQASMQQYTEFMRDLAARFSGETNVPISQLGIIHDNPASAQAMYAASEPLIIECEDLNDNARETLRNLALMSLSITYGKPLDDLTDEETDFIAMFRNPAMPSIVSQADAMIKIASVVPGFAGTDTFFEQIGFTEDIRRKAQEEIQRNMGDLALANVLSDLNNG